ncbi:hypothetical protein QMT40_000951 [Parvibaculaceae bacterium PLY_AMNH_Bact1]|nr:hypothetical protein QMT40_000951 [Parvibaculaceae bacterium PLY_AMNH_Bact1]
MFDDHKRLVAVLLAAVAIFLSLSAVWWIWDSSTAVPKSTRVVQQMASPATARLDRDMAGVLDLLADVERGVVVDGQPCERCTYLAQTVSVYRERAETALAGIRESEAALSQIVDRAPPGTKATLERALTAQQKAAARAIAGLRSYTNAMGECETERLCQHHDDVRAEETQPLHCSRDAGPVRSAAARIEQISDRVIAAARQCQTTICPVMDCARSAAFAADLQIAEISLAELAGGRTALPGIVEDTAPTGLAVVLGGVERALVRLAIDSAETSLEAVALSARAADMRSGLQSWIEETELRKGVQKHAWRVSALMAEIDVAAEWARQEDSQEYTQAYFEALSRAMLSAARLDAALAIAEAPAPIDLRRTGGPVCGANELANAYLKVGQAIAALGFCRAKSACPQPLRSLQGRPIRSASDRSIGALAAVTGALPLTLERAADAAVRASRPVALSLDQATYRTGEAMTVSADTAPSACLMSDGAIGLARAGSGQGREERYTLAGNAASELLLAAPGDPGRYVVRVFASPERGGHILSEHAVTVEELGSSCEGFTGLWDTEFGRLHLVDREGRVTGSYRRSEFAPRPGLLIASRERNVLDGIWLSELGRGGARLRLAPDGQSFKGTWGVKVDRNSGGGRWTGRCLLGVQ